MRDGLPGAAYFEEYMMKKIGIIFLICMLMLLTGCGEKEKDPTKEEIIKISITPMPSPTPAPSELAPEAVVTEGNLTMVNEYLANNSENDIRRSESSGE